MIDQKHTNKNYKSIDLSKFLERRRREEPFPWPKSFNLGRLTTSWQGMGKKNQIYAAILAITLVLIIIFLAITLRGMGAKETYPVRPAEGKWEGYITP